MLLLSLLAGALVLMQLLIGFENEEKELAGEFVGRRDLLTDDRDFKAAAAAEDDADEKADVDWRR